MKKILFIGCKVVTFKSIAEYFTRYTDIDKICFISFDKKVKTVEALTDDGLVIHCDDKSRKKLREIIFVTNEYFRGADNECNRVVCDLTGMSDMNAAFIVKCIDSIDAFCSLDISICKDGMPIGPSKENFYRKMGNICWKP